jgi:molybdenum cofactor guanylyltransferase
MNSNLVSAMILAGGLSSRMGQDKALIEVKGMPLLQRVCSTAQQCTDQIYIVTPWVERYQPLICSQPSTETTIRFLHEPRTTEDIAHSPLTGFLQGLSQLPMEARRDWVLLLACDLPRLDAAVLQRWIAALPAMPETVTACLPKNPKGWWEPLCGLYRIDCQPRIDAFVNGSGRSFQRWLSQESVHELPLPDTKMLLNCNTPADLQAFSADYANL